MYLKFLVICLCLKSCLNFKEEIKNNIKRPGEIVGDARRKLVDLVNQRNLRRSEFSSDAGPHQHNLTVNAGGRDIDGARQQRDSPKLMARGIDIQDTHINMEREGGDEAKEKPKNPEDDTQRYIVEDGLKLAIFGSYSYDPVRQIFDTNFKKATKCGPDQSDSTTESKALRIEVTHAVRKPEPDTMEVRNQGSAESPNWWARAKSAQHTTRWAYKNLTNLLKNSI